MAVLEEEVLYTKFRLSQHVIMQIYDQKSAALGEVFMTALLQAHTVNAGGFSHAAAGISISSVKRVSDKEWQSLQLSIAEDDKYMRRMSAEAWRLNKGTKETGNQPDLAAELAGERSAMLCGKRLRELRRRSSDWRTLKWIWSGESEMHFYNLVSVLGSRLIHICYQNLFWSTAFNHINGRGKLLPDASIFI